MHAIYAVGIYIAAKTVTVLVEETFSVQNMNDQAVIRLKIRQIYDRFINEDRQLKNYAIWKNLPIGITVFFIDEQFGLLKFAQLFLIGLKNDYNPCNVGEYKTVFTNLIEIVIYTIVIMLARVRAGMVCNYLKARVSPPFASMLERLENALKIDYIYIKNENQELGRSTTHFSEMERFREYRTWRDQAIRGKIFPLFQQFLEKSDVIENFLCPLTRELISIPVRDPKGRVYERDAIFTWIDRAVSYTPQALAHLPTEADRDRVRFRTSPYRDMVLTQADLTYDTDYHRNISVALKALFDQQIDQQFREGLLKYQVSMFHDRETLLKPIITDLTTKHVSGKIPEDKFIEACRLCRKQYGLAL